MVSHHAVSDQRFHCSFSTFIKLICRSRFEWLQPGGVLLKNCGFTVRPRTSLHLGSHLCFNLCDAQEYTLLIYFCVEIVCVCVRRGAVSFCACQRSNNRGVFCPGSKVYCVLLIHHWWRLPGHAILLLRWLGVYFSRSQKRVLCKKCL